MERQKVKITITPNDKIGIGKLVELIIPNDVPETLHDYKRISGLWRVIGIEHNILGELTYTMNVTLVRSGLENYEEYTAQKPVGISR